MGSFWGWLGAVRALMCASLHLRTTVSRASPAESVGSNPRITQFSVDRAGIRLQEAKPSIGLSLKCPLIGRQCWGKVSAHRQPNGLLRDGYFFERTKPVPLRHAGQEFIMDLCDGRLFTETAAWHLRLSPGRNYTCPRALAGRRQAARQALRHAGTHALT